jgi:hypothetical protein
MKLPKKYLTSNPNVMKREIKKHGNKADDDSSAYGPWDADYKSKKAGKGKPVETKKSKYTKKYDEMFGESEEHEMDNLECYECYLNKIEVAVLECFAEIAEENESGINESVDSPSSPVNKALKNKSDKTRFPLGILKQVWKRGYAAWKKGHIPGTTPQQWAMARVNSFVTGGKTTKMGDKALYQRGKKNLKKRK